MTLYAVKPRFQIALRQVAGWCAAVGITPDVLTVAGVICAAVAGTLLAVAGQSGWLWLVPPLLFARIAANALDGMVARATEAGHPWGSVVNETEDRVADVLVFGGFVLGGAVTGTLTLAVVPAVLAEAGMGWVALALFGTAVSDVCAFVVGSLLKGPKLAPHLSPGKTWAGLAGNLLGGAIALALIAPMLLPLSAGWDALAIVAIGGGGCVGDLAESLLKRAAGVKDAGTWLPGFGGLLDRVDSLLVVAPLLALLVSRR